VFKNGPEPTSSRVNLTAVSYDGNAARRVPRAKMLWKRKEDGGTFTERWWYIATNIDDLVAIKRRILAGTDIPTNKSVSPDGQQAVTMEQFGDVCYLTITGLSS
jgi:hypothetical protein